MIIVFDGPNKSGKSTLISNVTIALKEYQFKVRTRHWGPLKIDDREYTESLIEDTASEDIVIWDRSWVCESVYGKMLDRKRRLVESPWLGEFIHTRGVKLNGLCFIVSPSLAGLNIDLLDKSDAQFSDNPYWERQLFTDYANNFKWHRLYNSFTEESMHSMVNTVVDAVQNYENLKYKADVTFVIQDEPEFIPGGWLAGSSSNVIKFASKLAFGTLISDWIYLDEVDDRDFSKCKLVVTTSKEYYKKLNAVKRIKCPVVYLPLNLSNDEELLDEDVAEQLEHINGILWSEWYATEHILHV